MRPKLGDKPATPGKPPAVVAQPNGTAAADTATITDTALVQAVHAVYRGDTQRHLGLLRQSGLLAGVVAGKGGPGSQIGSADPLKVMSKDSSKTAKPSGKSEVARRIQKALSFSF